MWTTLIFGGALAVYAVLVVSTVTVVLLENRQPAKTIAWTVVLVMLPVIGLIIFYFFGQNIRRERYIGKRLYNLLTQRMLGEVSRIEAADYPEGYAPLLKLFEHTNKAVPTTNNSVDGYDSGAVWLAALAREIGAARRHIHLETYIIQEDAVGRFVRDLLADKVREGVEVRLIYDDVGCWNVSRRFFRSFTDAGIKVGVFLPVRFPSLTHKVNYRNHRKICVIDGRVGFVGGMNLALRYVSRRLRPWRDLHLRVEGDAVAGLQRLFLSDWNFVCGECRSEQRYFPAARVADARRGDAILQVVQSNPVSRYPEIMLGLTWAIYRARRYFYIQTPYFMPTEPVLQALQVAAMSGVDVRLMVPEKPDGFWLRYINDSHFEAVLEAGVRVFIFQTGFLHAKCAVADDEWCTVGSSNMDFRSFENNFEANVFIYGRQGATMLHRQFMDDLKDCREVKLGDWRRRPYVRQFMEACTRLLSPLL